MSLLCGRLLGAVWVSFYFSYSLICSNVGNADISISLTYFYYLLFFILGMLISVLIPCYVYLRLRRYLHARADWLCWWARSLAALALPFMLLCTAHNMYSLFK